MPCQGQAFRPGASARPTDQPHGVLSREGQERLTAHPPTACDRCQRSSSRTLPCPRCHNRLCASTSRISRVWESSSVPPANGEPTPRRTGRSRTRAQGRHCGTPEGQRLSPAHGGDTIPPTPTLVSGDLSDWMQDHHADLQDAMNGGNCVKVLELTSMMSNAAEKLAEMTGGMVP